MNGGSEQAVDSAITSMLQMQVLRADPKVAYLGTELTRRLNTETLAFINSRNHGSPNSQIVAPNGRGVYPGGSASFTNVHDYWTLLSGQPTVSEPGPSFLRDVLKNILSGTVPAHPDFSFSIAKLFGHLNDKWLSDEARLQISVLLQLVSVKTITQKTGLGRSKAIRILHLKPYLDAIK